MLIVLIVIGLALITFGGIVLLRFADRPGGSVKWMGAEFTSKGAGLPLIGLGVVFIGFAAVRFAPGAVSDDAAVTPQQKAAPTSAAKSAVDSTCMAPLLNDVPRDRVQTVEAGMSAVPIIGSHQPLDQPFVLLLTENGQRIGALRIRLYRGPNASADLYKIEEAVDAKCAPLQDLRNTSRGGNPRELVNWDTLRLVIGGNSYDLRIGGEGEITVGNFTRVHD